MRIVSHRRLVEFYSSEGHGDAQSALERWYDIAEKAEWKNLSDIKADFPTTDYVGNQHYVFDIRGNKYRLVVVVKFTIGHIFIRFVGTHSEYDKIENNMKNILKIKNIFLISFESQNYFVTLQPK